MNLSNKYTMISLNKVDKRHPSIHRMVRKMIALSPTAYGTHSKTLLKDLILVPPHLLKGLLDRVSKGRFLPKHTNTVLNSVSPHFCYGQITAKLCLFLISLHVGFHMEQTRMRTVSLITSRMPSPTSGKTVAHILQMARSPHFRFFDYGPQINLQKYNSAIPPEYNLGNVRVPIKALYALNDLLNIPEDALRTIRELGNVMEAGPVHHPKWNHLDFLFGRDARSLVYIQCLKILKT